VPGRVLRGLRPAAGVGRRIRHIKTVEHLERCLDFVDASFSGQFTDAHRWTVQQHPREMAQRRLCLIPGAAGACPRDFLLHVLQHVPPERGDRGTGRAIRREVRGGIADDRTSIGVGAELLEGGVQSDGLEVEQVDAVHPADLGVDVPWQPEVDHQHTAPRLERIGVHDRG